MKKKIDWNIVIPSIGLGFGIGVLMCALWIEFGL